MNEYNDEDSILVSIKHCLGIDRENFDFHDFDIDLIMHINSTFSILYQLGVKKNGYFINGPGQTWSDYLSGYEDVLNDVKSYMLIRVRLLFDPPASSSVLNHMKEYAEELEWRIQVGAENHSQGV